MDTTCRILSPRSVADRLERLRYACDKHNRDAAEIQTSVNVGFYLGGATPQVNPSGSLAGGASQAVDRIAEYVDAGVDGLNIALRPPVDWDTLQMFIEEVMPAFA
jgi:alkanesulfonate monooxygenase SsuD/methylene tetrahydromethanopterin reductase-like flavin-dependent oxidoreductase (luciferase family)